MVLLTHGLSQLPVEINHPSQILIKRYSALGELSLENFGKNSISAIEANNYLKTSDSDIIKIHKWNIQLPNCLLYTSPSPRDKRQSRMPSSA